MVDRKDRPELTPAEQLMVLWREFSPYLKGFETPVPGRNEACIFRLTTAVNMGDFESAKKQLDYLKEDNNGWGPYPIFAGDEVAEDSARYSADEVFYNNRVYRSLDPEQFPLDTRWEEFEDLVLSQVDC